MGSAGVALVVIAVCLVVAEGLPTATSPLVAVGAMALTAYTGHVIAPAVLDWDFESVAAWLAYTRWSVLATGWRLVLGQGPLERLLSSSSRARRRWRSGTSRHGRSRRPSPPPVPPLPRTETTSSTR